MAVKSVSNLPLYTKEFYILWETGIAPRDKIPQDTVAVCNITVDDGDTMLIRVFHSKPHEHHRAEDKLLDWLSVDGYITGSSKLDIELFFNHAPLAAFSTAFANLTQYLVDQDKEVTCEVKVVRMSNTDGEDEDSRENREGFRDLNEVGIGLSPVTGKDWQYLRQILRERKGLVLQERRCRRTRQQIQWIIKNPIDVATQADLKRSDVTDESSQTIPKMKDGSDSETEQDDQASGSSFDD